MQIRDIFTVLITIALTQCAIVAAAAVIFN
jgi:hypothetical protein